MPNQGTGITLTFVTSGISLLLTDLRKSGAQRGAVDTTHSASTEDADGNVPRTFRPSDLYDNGMLEAEAHFDPNDAVPFKAKESVKINFPADELATPAETTGPIHTFDAFVTAQDDSYQPMADETMKCTVRIKISGPITITPAVTAP